MTGRAASAARTGCAGTSAGETALPAGVRSEPIGNTAKMLGYETRPAGDRHDLTGPCRTHGTSRKTGHERVHRFPAGGFPSRIGGCRGLVHRVGLTLSRPLSAAEMINSVAGLSPLSAKCRLIQKSLIHKALSRSHRRDRPKRRGSLSLVRPDRKGALDNYCHVAPSVTCGGPYEPIVIVPFRTSQVTPVVRVC